MTGSGQPDPGQQPQLPAVERASGEAPAEDGPTRAEPAAGSAADRRAAEAARRRRRAAVFGEVLPEGTGDERSEGWGDRAGGTSDDWLRGQVPPHHG